MLRGAVSLATLRTLIARLRVIFATVLRALIARLRVIFATLRRGLVPMLLGAMRLAAALARFLSAGLLGAVRLTAALARFLFAGLLGAFRFATALTKSSLAWLRERVTLAMAVRVFIVIALLAGVTALFSCEKTPESEINMARAAFDEARSSGAESWAAEEFAHARSLLDSAMAEVEAQRGRFGPMRTYGRAKELLAAARTDAGVARDEARKERDRSREEAGDALSRARTALEGAKAALQIAPSPRDGRTELVRLRGELASIESQFTEIEQLIQEQEFRSASTRAADLASKVQRAVSRFFGGMESRSVRNGHSRQA